MPRKPWLKLHRSICTSSTWYATRPDKGLVEFIALLLHADENGVVPKEIVDTLCVIVRGRNEYNYRTKTVRNLYNLQKICTIIVRPDGSVEIPKFMEYQYLPNCPGKTKACEGKLNRAEQSRAEEENTPLHPPEGGADASLRQVTSPKPRRRTGDIAYTPEFEDFWQTWCEEIPAPHGSKQAAMRWWARRFNVDFTFEDIENAFIEYNEEMRKEQKKPNPRRSMHASTFIGEDRRWEEYLERARRETPQLPSPTPQVPSPKPDDIAAVAANIAEARRVNQ